MRAGCALFLAPNCNAVTKCKHQQDSADPVLPAADIFWPKHRRIEQTDDPHSQHAGQMEHIFAAASVKQNEPQFDDIPKNSRANQGDDDPVDGRPTYAAQIKHVVKHAASERAVDQE